jgi:hypothetical protein
MYQAGYKGNLEAARKAYQRLVANPLVQAAMLEVGNQTYRTKLPKAIHAPARSSTIPS